MTKNHVPAGLATRRMIVAEVMRESFVLADQARRPKIVAGKTRVA